MTSSIALPYALISPSVTPSLRIISPALKLQIRTQTIGFSQTGLGQWQATFPFPLAAVPVGQTTVSALLVATRSDGSSASVPVPLNVASS